MHPLTLGLALAAAAWAEPAGLFDTRGRLGVTPKTGGVEVYEKL